MLYCGNGNNAVAMIKQACESCQQRYNIPEKYVGKKIKCPGCAAHILVREFESIEENASAALTPKMSPSLVNGAVDARPTSQKNGQRHQTSESSDAKNSLPRDSTKLTYVLAWHDPFIAIGMIGLASGYIAVVLAVVAAVIYHATVNYKNILAIGEEVSFLVFVIYIGIIIVGLGVAFFLLKPILARKQKAVGRRVLPKNEPALFAMLNEITDYFELSPVKYCELDNSLNIRVNRQRSSDDFTIDIGMPMIASLDQSQVASIFAQELLGKHIESRSPFARLTRAVHNWFFDAAHLRDSWDHGLSRLRSRRGFFSTPIAMIIQMCVFLNRRIVWIFSLASGALSSIVFRNIYTQAALNAIELTGKEAFIESISERPLLRYSFERALVHYVKTFESRNPVDDIAGLVEAERKRLDKNAVADLLANEEKRWLRPWDTRPRPKKIIELTAGQPARGLKKHMGSAKSLFSNFKSISGNLTLTIQDYLLLGDFVQVREMDERMLNIATRKKLPTGMTRIGAQ